MRKCKVFALLFVIILVFSALSINLIGHNVWAVESIEQTIANNSFESGTNKTLFYQKYYIPDGWEASHSISVTADQTVKYDGQKSLKLNSVGNGFYVKTTNKVSVKSDTLYEVGFMAYASDIDNVLFGITVISYDESNVAEETFSVSEVSLESANEWKKVSIVFGTSPSAKSIGIQLNVSCENKNCNIDAVFMEEKSVINTEKGASVRLSEETPGIRFSGTVDKNSYDFFVSSFSNVNVGIVIMPKVYYDKITDFKFSNIKTAGLTYVDIMVNKWNNEETAESDGFYGFYCAMVKLKEVNIPQTFCARAYLRYTENGIEKYVYSDFNLVDNARSVQEVARAEITENGANYTAEDKLILEYFANGK